MKRWEPVQHWHTQENWNMGRDKPRRVINTTINGRMITLEEYDRSMSVLLPQGMGVCRAVEVEDVPVEAMRICASYGMPLGITYAQYNAARDEVLAWLAQATGGQDKC